MANLSMLWSSSEETPWAMLWARYDDVLQSIQKTELVELDAWYLTTFPSILRTREPDPYMTKKELQRLMKWKLKKGKWRPQLMKFVTELDEDDVETASREAFQQLKQRDLQTATEALCVLKGVGPATASAVLAAYDESVPFMADEALEAIAGIIGPRKYTLSHFLSFAKELNAKAKWLNVQRDANDDRKADVATLWTAQRVQLCLYAEAHEGASVTNTKVKAAAAPATKRKRNNVVTTLPCKRKAEKAQVESTKDHNQSLRRSQRKRRQPEI